MHLAVYLLAVYLGPDPTADKDAGPEHAEQLQFQYCEAGTLAAAAALVKGLGEHLKENLKVLKKRYFDQKYARGRVRVPVWIFHFARRYHLNTSTSTEHPNLV
jgi:hypothetical protein